MQKEKKDKHFLHKPIYEGGPKAMKALVKENLRYPKEAFDARIEGSVKVKYTIDHKGKVVKTRIISSLGYGCDEEASRIVKMLKFEVPKNRKMKVVFHKNITIHFRLPKKTEKQPTTIQYNITKQKPASQEPDESSGSGYNYTIEF